MTTNQERADRRVIFAAITTTGLVEVRHLSATTDQWYVSWLANGRPRCAPRASRDRQMESFIAGKIATLRAVSAGQLLNRPSRVA